MESSKKEILTLLLKPLTNYAKLQKRTTKRKREDEKTSAATYDSHEMLEKIRGGKY